MKITVTGALMRIIGRKEEVSPGTSLKKGVEKGVARKVALEARETLRVQASQRVGNLGAR